MPTFWLWHSVIRKSITHNCVILVYNNFIKLHQYPKNLNQDNFSNWKVTNLSLHCILGCDVTGVLSETTLTPLSVSSVDVFLLLDFLFESLLWRNLKSWPVTNARAQLLYLLKYRMIPIVKTWFIAQCSIIFVILFIFLKHKQISVCSTHITHQASLVSVHPDSRALTCSSECVHCPHDAYVLTPQGSHAHFQSLTRMLKIHPADKNKI